MLMKQLIELNLPFVPDMVQWHAYEFGLCDLCKVQKEMDESFDNSNCIHCKRLTKIVSAIFSHKKQS